MGSNFNMYGFVCLIIVMHVIRVTFVEQLEIYIPVLYWSQLFSGLHVPRVKETPSLGFSGDGLLLSEV